MANISNMVPALYHLSSKHHAPQARRCMESRVETSYAFWDVEVPASCHGRSSPVGNGHQHHSSVGFWTHDDYDTSCIYIYTSCTVVLLYIEYLFPTWLSHFISVYAEKEWSFPVSLATSRILHITVYHYDQFFATPLYFRVQIWVQ